MHSIAVGNVLESTPKTCGVTSDSLDGQPGPHILSLRACLLVPSAVRYGLEVLSPSMRSDAGC